MRDITIIERARIGNATKEHPYGIWGYRINGENYTEIPAGLGNIFVCWHIGWALSVEEGMGQLRDKLRTFALCPQRSYIEKDLVPYNAPGTPMYLDYPGMVRIGGNFHEYSFGFSFDTADAELIAEFEALFAANRAMPEYAQALRDIADKEARDAAYLAKKEAEREAKRIEALRALAGMGVL